MKDASLIEEEELEDGFELIEPEVNCVDEETAAVIAVGLEKPEKVKEGLAKFFQGLHWSVGGEIPEEILFSETYVNLIVNIGNSGAGLSNAIELGYPLIERHGKEYGSFARSGPYTEDLDTELCLYVLRRVGRLKIPQGYVGGIFLIYLELCEGVKLR